MVLGSKKLLKEPLPDAACYLIPDGDRLLPQIWPYLRKGFTFVECFFRPNSRAGLIRRI
jgi:hypothetical protein